MHFLNESQILHFLIQLFLIIILTRTIGELFRKWKQPVLTAELLIGIIIGPTILGRFFPGVHSLIFPDDVIQKTMLETIAWVGMLFLLLDTGLEIDFSSAWRQKGNALIIAFIDIIIPMTVAFIPCYFLPDSYLVNADKRFLFALYMSVIMSISAMPIASRVLHDLKILKTDLGYLTMSALAVNDIIGWVLFTIIMGLFTQGNFNVISVIIVIAATIGFSTLALTLGRFASNRAIDFFHKNKLPEPASSFTFACLLGLLFGVFTQSLGIHALFGFFIAGIIVGEAKRLREETRTVISQMVHSLFVPVFFVSIGLKIDFISNFDLYLVVIITSFGVFGKFLGTWIGVTISNVPKVNRTLISIAHTSGGMMEIVVALLALETGLITSKVFIAIVCSAVLSAIIMGPWMRAALKKRKDISVANFLKLEKGVQFLACSERSEAIENMINYIPQFVKNADLKAISHEIMEREKDYSTAVGDGIAIPHVRLKNISDPFILFGLSVNGIDWDSPDGKPVHFVFFLFTPVTAKDLHLEILSKIVKIMQDKNYQIALLETKNHKDLSKSLTDIFSKR